jgi:hypothetical protein
MVLMRSLGWTDSLWMLAFDQTYPVTAQATT